MITVTRRLEWDAAHRVLRHESKCSTLHGHRYSALLTCSSETGLDTVGRIVDFGEIKRIVGTWIDTHWDHTTLVNRHDETLLAFCNEERFLGKRKPFEFDGEPTAENIAALLLDVATNLLQDTGVQVDAVEVFETPNCSARAIRRPAIH